MEKKMKPFVFVRPKTGKEKLVFFLFLIPIICGCAPVILLFNKPILVLGMPLLMLWAICVVLMVIVVTRIAYKLGV
jgi:tryptophan-rich sensory protein